MSKLFSPLFLAALTLPAAALAQATPAASGGTKANGVAITFPASGGGSGAPVTALYLVTWTTADSSGRILDALLISGGGLVIASGTTPNFAIGTVNINEF